jgi:hypothetical protein
MVGFSWDVGGFSKYVEPSDVSCPMQPLYRPPPLVRKAVAETQNWAPPFLSGAI